MSTDNCDITCRDGVYLERFILPLAGEGEEDPWPRGIRATLYLIGLVWCFMGVAIVSDVFMGAIEKITSKKTRRWNQELKRYQTITVWNETVANLTLMALGSSAPEILLSLIELISKNFYSGSLGPSTIVGSAAFNLLCISAVCVAAIPEGEARTIKDIGVFSVTASFSIFAYLWLYLIVSWISEDVIDISEGIITFLLFPVLVTIAYMADKGYFSLRSADGSQDNMMRRTITNLTKDELAAMEMSVIQKTKVQLSDEQLAKLIELDHLAERKTRAAYRVGATRKMVGGRRISAGGIEQEALKRNQILPITDVTSGVVAEMTQKPKVVMAFNSRSYAVMENIGTLSIPVDLTGFQFDSKRCMVSVEYKTRDGTAHANSDYEPVSGKLEFAPGEERKHISVTIIDDAAYEDDELFYVDLFNPSCSDQSTLATLGENKTATVAILDDDHPGTLSFEEEALTVQEDQVDKSIDIKVCRKGGCNGEISCRYYTESATAIGGRDFEPLDDFLKFESGQACAEFPVTIKSLGRYERKEVFRIVLTEPKGGARFDKMTDGGDEANICTITIVPNEKAKSRTDKIMGMLVGNWDKAQLGHANWKDQFQDALFVNGGDDEGRKPTFFDWAMHIVTVFWKVLFAAIPPVDFCGGWLCFVCSLLMIGVVTAVIGDMASLLGCVLGVPDAITAITFVALGTSLPDTFASKTAAEQDPYADASVGNVTGSNSVNVFLGLGLPWTIGSIYWSAMGFKQKWADKYPDVFAKFPDGGKFVVQSNGLGFSVIVFSCCGILGISILMIRRRLWQAELGGPVGPKYITSFMFVLLWFVYVGCSSWKVLDLRSDDPCYN